MVFVAFAVQAIGLAVGNQREEPSLTQNGDPLSHTEDRIPQIVFYQWRNMAGAGKIPNA